MKKLRVLIIAENLGTDASRCSTFMADEAITRGHSIFECEQSAVSLLDGEIICTASQFFAENHDNGDAQKFIIKNSFDVVFFRPNSFTDMEYMTALYLLQMIEDDVMVLNRPSSLIRYSEKIIPHHFEGFSPPSLISKNRAEIIEFMKEHNGAIAKPLHAYGGHGIVKLELHDTAKLDDLLARNEVPFVYQKFLDEIYEGDKRIMFIHGKYVGAVNRIPPEGSFLAHILRGARGEKYELNDYQRMEVIPKVERFLQDNGIILCGIDMIGNYVTEMNVGSPLMFPALHLAGDMTQEQKLWEGIEEKWQN